MSPLPALVGFSGNHITANRTETELIQVLSAEFALAAGMISGISGINKFGHRNSISSATAEQVWDHPSAFTYWTSSVILGVSSSDVDDNSLGSGARTIELFGLDEDYNRISESVILAGQTKVETNQRFLRVYRAIVRSAGVTGFNEGLIHAYDTSSGVVSGQPTDDTKVAAEVGIGRNQTNMAIYTVPAGCTGYLLNVYGSVIARAGVFLDILLYIRPFGEVFQHNLEFELATGGNTDVNHKYDMPIVITEKSDVEVRALASTNNVDCSAGFTIVLVEN